MASSTMKGHVRDGPLPGDGAGGLAVSALWRANPAPAPGDPGQVLPSMRLLGPSAAPGAARRRPRRDYRISLDADPDSTPRGTGRMAEVARLRKQGRVRHVRGSRRGGAKDR